jgi:hypothetical protein
MSGGAGGVYGVGVHGVGGVRGAGCRAVTGTDVLGSLNVYGGKDSRRASVNGV